MLERRRTPRTFGTLPADSRLSSHKAEVMAISALDTLVAKLIERNDNRVPPDFLDWVGTEGTNYALLKIRKYMELETFRDLMNSDRAELTILRVVYRSIMPKIQARYGAVTNKVTQYDTLDFPASNRE